ncbi:hypothetical protein BJ742DRAFT_767583 [Cladochytrium replicatum]|nr:hypothetical protein BJ742DRAFT_767583 [Cladochytrium replicatum]
MQTSRSRSSPQRSPIGVGPVRICDPPKAVPLKSPPINATIRNPPSHSPVIPPKSPVRRPSQSPVQSRSATAASPSTPAFQLPPAISLASTSSAALLLADIRRAAADPEISPLALPPPSTSSAHTPASVGEEILNAANALLASSDRLRAAPINTTKGLGLAAGEFKPIVGRRPPSETAPTQSSLISVSQPQSTSTLVGDDSFESRFPRLDDMSSIEVESWKFDEVAISLTTNGAFPIVAKVDKEVIGSFAPIERELPTAQTQLSARF